MTFIRPLRPEALVIGHRGVPGHRLEHTRDSYLLAVELGADVLEPDLVVSADGVLIVRHDVELSATTDVADHPEFADRHRTLTVASRVFTGWFVHDFTLAELRTLRCRERWPANRPANTPLDGASTLLTFDEVVAIAAVGGRQRGGSAGAPIPIWPELKHPSHFAARGLDPVPLMLDALRRHGLDESEAPVAVQCFEPTTLQRLAAAAPMPLLQLVDGVGAPHDRVIAGDDRPFTQLVTPAGLAEVATYAAMLGLNKRLVIPLDTNGRMTRPTPVVTMAHDVGLEVYPYTFRDENAWLPPELRAGPDRAATGRAVEEYLAYLDAGVDGMFSDHAATALAARRRWAFERGRRADAENFAPVS